MATLDAVHDATFKKKADRVSGTSTCACVKRFCRVLSTAARSFPLRETHIGDRVELSGDGAGAHVVLWPRRHVAEEAAIAGAASRGVDIYGISPYFLKPPLRTGIMLGYSRSGKRKFGTVSGASVTCSEHLNSAGFRIHAPLYPPRIGK
jgi:hypothetical protein